MKATYRPVKRGMTEAVTRGELEAAQREGRMPVANVKQLTWFDTNDEVCVYGVLGGEVHSWYENGSYYINRENDYDIFVPTRFEWQWNIIENGKYVGVTDWFTSEVACEEMYESYWKFERIEGSKRMVKD